MQDKNNESMDDIEFDVLTEIGNIGAGNATTALSQLINARIDMRVPKVELLTFAELAEVIGGAETLVAGILLSLEGDIQGSMLFILESNAARLLVQQLMGCKDDSDLYHCRLSQCSTPLCAGAGFECDYECVRRDGPETDPHCNDGTLDIADHLYGRSDGGSPEDAVATGSHDPSCGYVSLYPYFTN